MSNSILKISNISISRVISLATFRSYNTKVFNSVVFFYSIKMMYYFFSFEWSTKMFLHIESMFQHISRSTFLGTSPFVKNENISQFIYRLTSFVRRIIYSLSKFITIMQYTSFTVTFKPTIVIIFNNFIITMFTFSKLSKIFFHNLIISRKEILCQ